jgi:RNA polymerase sigma factor (sigma-70 family)
MEDALTMPESAAPSGASTRASGRPRLRWNLDRGGFDALLAALDPNRDVAAERYAALRERLSRFFSWNNAVDPDAQADEVLDRLARRVAAASSDDEAVRQPEKFAAGVARMLLREGWRAQKANVQMISSFQQQSEDQNRLQEEQREMERLSALLEECLNELPPGQQELIRRYYCTESRSQIDGRKQLAEEFKISLNALRNRALRIRGDVERKARKRLELTSL